MLSEIACPTCGNLLKVRPEYAGMFLRCPRCDTRFQPQIPGVEPEEIEVLPLAEVEEIPVLETADDEEVYVPELIVEPPLTDPKPQAVAELPLAVPDAKPQAVQEKPPFIDVHQPWRKPSHRLFRMYLLPDELRVIFIGVPLTAKDLADPRTKQRREERLAAITQTPFPALLTDHRLNYRVELDDVTEATLGPCGFWYRLMRRSRESIALLTLWHRTLPKMRFEILNPESLQKLQEFLPGSLGKRLRTRTR